MKIQPTIPAVLETDVFANERGEITIKQTNPWDALLDGTDGESIVTFPPSYANAVIAAIQAAVEALDD
jgi:hypothetical protein